MKLSEIQELMKSFDASGLTGLELSQDGTVLRLQKGGAPLAGALPASPAPAPAASPAAPAPAEPAEMGMRCRAGLCSFWVDWQGNLMNCGMYASAKLPLGDTTMAEAWPRLVEDTAQVRYAPYCAVCPNQHLCHACIAMVANECGQLTGRPEYLCQMNQAAAGYYQEYLHRLPENGHAPAEPDDFGHLDPAEPCGP